MTTVTRVLRCVNCRDCIQLPQTDKEINYEKEVHLSDNPGCAEKSAGFIIHEGKPGIRDY